jgi:ketosteroid isomerase-like protein
MKFPKTVFPVALALVATPIMADTQSEIEEREAAFYAAFLNSDADTMRDIFADGFLYQHGSGSDFNEASFSALIESRTAVVTRADTPTLALQDLGDTVIASGASRVEGTIGGNAFGGTLRFVNVWHRDAGQWFLYHRNSEFVD